MQFLSFTIIFSLAPYFLSAIADQTTFHQPITDNNNMPSLADLLTIESSASIFYSYARELALSEFLSEPASFAETSGRARNGLSLLVPTNKAVMALARKPHQGPSPKDNDEDITISEEEFYKKSKDNVQRWVEAHIIPTSPLTYPAPTTTYDTLLHGKSVSLTSSSGDEQGNEDWQRVTIDDGIRILSMKQASNGVLYLIDGTISVDS
ncbi:hypothetical protein GGU10DRAFT_363994 [Lentinula aff. detonsa]|uniref:FAS1 domain-containing protein n=1 Tax=Lentinula aff. detonsa TaxID=2804958 RepID=A0AA38NKE3_9AGAR|nr:hypothetical protein GGU10DRAFT_363994 [Lentinula aff. detonsa]